MSNKAGALRQDTWAVVQTVGQGHVWTSQPFWLMLGSQQRHRSIVLVRSCCTVFKTSQTSRQLQDGAAAKEMNSVLSEFNKCGSAGPHLLEER